MSKRAEIRMIRGDATNAAALPIPFTDRGRKIGEIVRVWFDGEYTCGEVLYLAERTMNDNLKIGDLVRLKGSTMNLTIVGDANSRTSRGGDVLPMFTCAWFAENMGSFLEQDFPAAALVKIGGES